jgi:mitogen-activated protein kinase kinase kinase
VGIPAFGFDDTATWSAVSSQASWLANTSQDSVSTNITTPMDEMAGRGDRMYANAMQQQSRMLSNASTATQMQSSIPPELAAQWTPDRVLMWLQANKFSKDWQETFKALNLHGPQFLELGSGRGGRGNWGMMHQQVYPRLAAQCYSSGTGWNQPSEREEGKRMRRLIRGLWKVDGMEVPPKQGGGHVRMESFNGGNMSAGPDGDSPNVSFFPSMLEWYSVHDADVWAH